MLTKLTVRNFKSLVDVTVEFPRLAVLFGPNAAGKSTSSTPSRPSRVSATHVRSRTCWTDRCRCEATRSRRFRSRPEACRLL